MIGTTLSIVFLSPIIKIEGRQTYNHKQLFSN